MRRDCVFKTLNTTEGIISNRNVMGYGAANKLHIIVKQESKTENGIFKSVNYIQKHLASLTSWVVLESVKSNSFSHTA